MNSISISGKNWLLKKYNQDDLSFLKENFYLDEIISKLLSIRQIKKDEVNSFLNPSIKNFYQTLIFSWYGKINKKDSGGILKGEKIGIFGDYDVDGATSTALLGNYFSRLNQKFEIYIPDRKTEGYGPSIKSFKELINKKVNIIHCRLWTLSFEAINFAKKQCRCNSFRSSSIWGKIT